MNQCFPSLPNKRLSYWRLTGCARNDSEAIPHSPFSISHSPIKNSHDRQVMGVFLFLYFFLHFHRRFQGALGGVAAGNHEGYVCQMFFFI